MDDDLWILDDGGDDVEELVGFLLSGDQRDQSTCQRDFFFSFSGQRNALAAGGAGAAAQRGHKSNPPGRAGCERFYIVSCTHAKPK